MYLTKRKLLLSLLKNNKRKGISMTTSEAIFEFEKLKFEIDFFNKRLISEMSLIGSFHYVMDSIEAKIPEWKARARMIEVNLT